MLSTIYWITLFCIMLHIFTLHTRLRGLGDESLRETIERYNDEEEIRNWFNFDYIERETVIIVVQVHNRTVYLQNLIDSLSRVKHIEKTLIIFSHDYYSEEINQMIRNITFAKVLQIFFPYSIQLHPNQFPGNEVLHGKHIMDKTVRRADLAQLKHHWWWKANRIFKQLHCLYDHEGMVIFLEEDFYVAEDLVHMVMKMRETADEVCPSCEMLVLGSSYNIRHDDVKIRNVPKVRRIVDTLAKMKVVNWDKLDEHYDDLSKNFFTFHDFSRVEIIVLQAHLGKIAFAFNKTVWLNIVANSELFCNHDDYNWDISLVNLSEKRKFGPIRILASKVPRVFHLGKCGVHHTNNDCNSTELIDKVKRLLQRSKASMFPQRLSVLSQNNRTRHVNMKNGGWMDERDHQLCRTMANVTMRIGYG